MVLIGSPNTNLRGVVRAQRYAIGAALRYRVQGDKEWLDGVIQDISVSGVLMLIKGPLDLDTTIEIRFFLPVELNGEFAAEVFCRGSVVRLSAGVTPDDSWSIAARIDHWRFLRQMSRKRS